MGEEAILNSTVFEITDEATWRQKVDDAPGKVFVEFFVTWCPHCQREAPILDGIADSLEADGIGVYRANAEVMYTKGDEYGLTETPSFIFLEDGQLKGKHEGFLDAEQLSRFAHTGRVEG